MSTPENPFAAPEPAPASDQPGQQPPDAPPPPRGYGQPPYGQQAYGQQAYGQQAYAPPPYRPPHYPGYAQPYGMGPAMNRPTNGMAIASMVLGILWLWWLGSLLALVFGYIAKSQIRERGDAGGGMATAGIVLGWIGVGFFTLFVLFALLGAVGSGYSTY